MVDIPRVLILLGTRPEAIKLAPVAQAFRSREEQIDVRVVSTGQHDDLLDSAVASLEMTIDEDLAIMRPNQDLYDIGIQCLDKLRTTLKGWSPDVVVVQGDTATVFFGGLAGFYEGAKVAHVEAGLRSGNKWAPFPEEKDNLVAEGIPSDQVNVTGNTVIDAVQELARMDQPIADRRLRELLDTDRRIVLITAHRRESFGEPMRESFGALRTLAEEHSDHVFVYPVHPNPNVLRPAQEILADVANFHLLEPLCYFDLISTLSRSYLVLTDSGGNQEEGPSFGVPVLVMREVTERPEGVAAGVAALVGTSREKILTMGRELLNDPSVYQSMAQAVNPYGDGRAGERIADILVHSLLGVPRKTEDWG
jgi:UDP-N-acetylglucosamine 2-epimerase (non-hydrolysing)